MTEKNESGNEIQDKGKLVDIMAWTEKYRPHKLSGVYGNEEIFDNIRLNLKKRNLMCILLSGVEGVGKTTTAIIIAYVIAKGVADNIRIENAATFGKKDISKSIIPFCKKPSLAGGTKVFVLDEFDHATGAMQAAFRRPMEIYSGRKKNKTIFVLCCNYEHKIINPIKSRCEIHKLKKIPDEKMLLLAKDILKKENIEFTEKDVLQVVEMSEGKPRNMIIRLQSFSASGTLVLPKVMEYDSKLIELLKTIFSPKNRSLDKSLETYETIVKEFSNESREMLMKMDKMIINNDKFNDEIKEKALIVLSDTDFRISQGGSESLQMRGMIAKLYAAASLFFKKLKPLPEKIVNTEK